MRVTTTAATEGPFWPEKAEHLWGAFPFLAIEMGGYGDLEAIDPHDGRTLNADVFIGDDEPPYAALRRLVDAMEDRRWLDSPADRAEAFGHQFTSVGGADFAYRVDADRTHPAWTDQVDIEDYRWDDPEEPGYDFDGYARTLGTWWNDEAARLRATREQS